MHRHPGRQRFPWMTRVAALALLAGLHAATRAQPDVQALPVVEVAPGVHVHAGAQAEWKPADGGDVANAGFIVGGRCVAVIDTGGSPAVGERLRAAVARVTPLPVCYVISTHVHPDHTMGHAAFAAASPRPEFVAHAKFPASFAARAPFYLNAIARDTGAKPDPSIAVFPTMTVETSRVLDLGGRTITLRAWPTAHTDNDLTVTDDATRTFFAGDLLFRGHLPVLDGSLRGWMKAMDEMRRLDVGLVVPGHGEPGRDLPALLAPQARYLEALLSGTREAIRAGLTITQAVERAERDREKDWLLSDAFHRRNATAAYAELEWE